MGKTVQLPYVGPKVQSLLLWEDPKMSGIVLGAATVSFLAYVFNPFTAAQLVCYGVAIGALAAFLWAQMGSFVSKAGPPVPPIFARGLTEDEARKYAESVRPQVNKLLASIGIMLSGKDMKLSLLTVGGAYFGARVFAIISPIPLAYLLVILAFTLPKVYELKQEEIDKVVAIVRAKVEKLYAQFNENVLSKIPKAAPAAAKKAM